MSQVEKKALCMTKRGIGEIIVSPSGEMITISYDTDLGKGCETVSLTGNPELIALFTSDWQLRIDEAFNLFTGLDFAWAEMSR